METCVVDGCEKAAARRCTMCWACIKARERNGSPRRRRANRYENPIELLTEAVLHVADVDAEEEASAAQKERAWQRLRMAFARYKAKVRNNVHRGQQNQSP